MSCHALMFFQVVPKQSGTQSQLPLCALSELRLWSTQVRLLWRWPSSLYSVRCVAYFIFVA